MNSPSEPLTEQTKMVEHLESVESVMKILISPSGFKESLGPQDVAKSIEVGIRRILPNAQIRKVPLIDGGEGSVRGLVEATAGELRHLTVTGPIGRPIESYYGFLGGQGQKRVAIIEMAAAAGLSLVPKWARDPTMTTTYGVGELIKDALEQGAEKILVGCGDSGTNDGGAGMLQALGARLLDDNGEELPQAGGGRSLSRLADIDLRNICPCIKDVELDVACNWENMLCGPNGVARVYGPQKGASPDQVELLSKALDRLASISWKKFGYDIARMPGSGASGGMGAGLILLGARMRPRYDAIMEWLGIDDIFKDCQLVITAEGGIDSQTSRGKIPTEVALRAKEHGIPVILLAGTVGAGADVNYEAGIDAYTSILQTPTSLEEAIKQTDRLLVDGAESAMRMVMVGLSLRT